MVKKMKIEVEDHVIYMRPVVVKHDIKAKWKMPTIEMVVIKIHELCGEDEFKDLNGELFKNYRVRFLIKDGQKNKLEYDGYNYRKIQEEEKNEYLM